MPRMARRARQTFSLFRMVLRSLYGFSFAALLALLIMGASFYMTPLPERAHHSGYWVWKAGGRIGLTLGAVGAGMMTLMLFYSVRKRVKLLRKLGPLSQWLDIHIFLGTIGPLCIILHSAFKAQGLVSLSFWSMLAVALSGFLGRYIYLQIPRTRAGEALSLREVEALDRDLSKQLHERFGLEEHLLRRLDLLSLLSTPGAAQKGLLSGLMQILFGDIELRRRLRLFTRECPGVPRRLLREFERVVRQKAVLRRRIALWDRLHEVFHYWHVIHKPFAVVMYLFMAVHIAVAVMTGYAWRGGP